MVMRALSVKQPWASLIAFGHKTLEVRSWDINYRGPVCILSSLQSDTRELAQRFSFQGMALGRSMAFATITDTRVGRPEDAPDSLVLPGEYDYVWVLDRVVTAPQHPVCGGLGLLKIPVDTIDRELREAWLTYSAESVG